MQPKIDNFVLIIGAMKSGTTSLYNYLIQHPEIAACHTKEVNFFGNPNRFAKGFDFYQNLWDWNPQQHKYAIEATPSYTRVTHPKAVNAAENIYKIAKEKQVNFKFIYILRNPIDRIESHYTQGRKHNYQDTAQPLSVGINQEIIDTSRYAMQAKEYYQRFSTKDILLLDFEVLKQNSSLLLKKVCNFLDIDANYEFNDSQLIHNSHSKKSSKVFIPGYSYLRKTSFVQDRLKFMPQNFKQNARSIRNLFARHVENEYVKLSPEQRQYIFKELAEDLKNLQNDYNFDVSRWSIEIKD